MPYEETYKELYKKLSKTAELEKDSYEYYTAKQPMRDGLEIRLFFEDFNEEEESYE